MKKAFFDAVRRGAKTTTVRYWKHARMRPGQVHTVPGLGKVRIEEVRQVRPADLTAGDAANDGFESLQEMLSALAEIYPALAEGAHAPSDGRKLYVVRFTLVTAGERSGAG